MVVVGAAGISAAVLENSMQTNLSDIIIVGGGMVGLTLACLLAQQTSLSITVLESQAETVGWDEDNYHHRVSAIAVSSSQLFQSINIWQALSAKRVSPFTEIAVWDANDKGYLSFHSREVASPYLGHIIENNLIQAVMMDKIATFPHVQYHKNVTLTNYHEADGQVYLTSDNAIYAAKLAIAADGGNSWLRKMAGIAIDRHDYHQRGIVATVETSLPHQTVARQIFLNSGPLAFLPLASPTTSSIVWSLPNEEATRMLQLDDAAFKCALAAAFKHKLGDIVSVSKRYAFPLAKQQASYYVKSRVVLVGDAAHTVHPLAGQGVNIGLLDAASLAEIIIENVKQRRDIANPLSLRRYERWRKAENLTLLTGVDIIKRVFATDHHGLQSVRTIGLNFIQRNRWLKNIFTKHAIGVRN